MSKQTTQYRALVGLNYPGKRGETRVEPGATIKDLKGPTLKRLLSRGLIERVDADASPR